MPFYMIGGFAIVLFFVLWYFLPPVTKHLQNENRLRCWAIYKYVFKDANQRNGIWFTFFIVVGHFMIIPFIARYMVQNVGLPENKIALIYFFGGLVTVFSGLIVGRLTDKHGALKMFVIFAILATAPVILITNLPPVSLTVALLSTCVFFMFVSARMIPMQTLVSGVVTPQHRGSFESIRSAFMQLGAGTAGLISGSIVGGDENSPVLNYPMVGYISLVFIAICLYFAPKLKKVQGT
jgi:predicted MFS family arabinose efflux permease